MNKLLKWLVIVPVRIYQYTLSPLLGNNCRFSPTCSNYMIGAVQEWGLLKGVWMGLKRISRCHPWGGSGYDPVPKKPEKHHH